MKKRLQHAINISVLCTFMAFVGSCLGTFFTCMVDYRILEKSGYNCELIFGEENIDVIFEAIRDSFYILVIGLIVILCASFLFSYLTYREENKDVSDKI